RFRRWFKLAKNPASAFADKRTKVSNTIVSLPSRAHDSLFRSSAKADVFYVHFIHMFYHIKHGEDLFLRASPPLRKLFVHYDKRDNCCDDWKCLYQCNTNEHCCL